MVVQEFVHQEFMTRYTLEGLYDWNIPTFPKGGVPGLMTFSLTLKGLFYLGVCCFFSQGFFLLYAGMLSTSFIKNPVTAGDVTQSYTICDIRSTYQAVFKVGNLNEFDII